MICTEDHRISRRMQIAKNAATASSIDSVRIIQRNCSFLLPLCRGLPSDTSPSFPCVSSFQTSICLRFPRRLAATSSSSANPSISDAMLPSQCDLASTDTSSRAHGRCSSASDYTFKVASAGAMCSSARGSKEPCTMGIIVSCRAMWS